MRELLLESLPFGLHRSRFFCYNRRIPLYRHPKRHPHTAQYDAHGNIIIPEDAPEQEYAMREPSVIWQVTDDDEVVQDVRKTSVTNISCEDLVTVLKGVRGTMMRTTTMLVEEGQQQYVFSIRNLYANLKRVPNHMKSAKIHFGRFLTQPVWVLDKHKKAKEYSRGTLFMFDVFRFGGTFAFIFAMLFVSLNYESFWKIVSPYLDPVDAAQALRGNAGTIDDVLREKLLQSPSLATAGVDEDISLLSFLPPVGPPENRIIIPKLNLNVPLVTPSFDSLLREDWEGVETDIQDALQHGVVHYPGTARPGQAGNFFITGHSSYYPWAEGKYKTVFARLHELNPGDEYWVYYGGDKHRYIVGEKKEVKPSDVTVLDQPVGERVATIMTCTPVGTTLRRLIVTATEVDPETGVPLKVGEREHRELQKIVPAALPI